MGTNIAIAVGVNAAFFILIIVVLYVSYRHERSFTDYAVGGRAYGPWYIAMSYINSWFPGTMFISFLGFGVVSGVVGLYVLSYSLIGLATMYFMATRAWNWGQRFNLRTQPDMMKLRYDSSSVRVVASVIGVASLFPWIILSMQSLGVIFEYMTYGQISTTAALLLGVLVIVVRQYWTVRMGMRGLVVSDLVQGIVAYIVGSITMLLVISIYFDGFTAIQALKDEMWKFPGPEGLGTWYFAAITFTGIIGSLCWPTSYQRIYTARSVRTVKTGTLLAMPIIWVFATLLLLSAFSMASQPDVLASPQNGWFITMFAAGGPWLLAVGTVIVFAAAMGWIDGCIQVSGTQLSNDIIGTFKKLEDKQLTRIAKTSMVVFLILGAIAAYVTYSYDNLVNLAIISYQGVVQLSVPMFLGLFWKRGTKEGALAGMIVGFVLALVLTAIYPTNIPWLGGVTAGIPALAINLIVYLGFTFLRPQSASERARVDELFSLSAKSIRLTEEEQAIGVTQREATSTL